MKINFSPQRRDDTLAVTKQGDVLTINGTDYDFTDLTDGGTLPADAVDSEYVIGSVDRVDGDLELTLLLPHGPNATEAARFPEPIIDPADGEVELPK